jgi:hypothetical protein
MRLPFAFVLAFMAAAATAQPAWRSLPAGPSVSLDVLKAVGGQEFMVTDEEGNELGTVGPDLLHSAQILSARVPFGGRFALVADIPFAYYSYSFPAEASGFPQSESDFGVGNPYVGAEALVADGLTVAAGVRLPVARGGDGAALFLSGLVADVEQPEAFYSDMVSGALGVRYERALSPGLSVRLQATPTVRYSTYNSPVIPDEEETGQDRTAVAVAYGAQLAALAGPVRLSGGFVGRQHLRDPAFFYLDPMALALGATAEGLPVQPGLLVRVPLRGYPDVNAVVGLSLTVPVR